MGLINFTNQEFQLVQQLVNEMYQTAVLRTGPMGGQVIAIRNKFTAGTTPVDLTDVEKRFLLFVINETFQTSHSAIVKSQLGLQMQLLRPSTEKRTVSDISDPLNPTQTQFSGTYSTMWDVMTNVMTKLGMSATPIPEPIMVIGNPITDPSTPMHHDINDGTGYNNR